MGLFRSSYFFRLLVFSFLLGVGPVIFLGIASYFLSSNAIQNQVNNANMQVLEQMRTSVEQILQLTDSTSIQLMDSPLVTDALQSDIPPLAFQLKDDMTSALTHIQVPNLYHEVEFYNLQRGWMLTDVGRLTRASEESWETNPIISGIRSSARGSAWYHDSANIYLAKKRPFNSASPSAVLIVKIPVTQLNSVLQSGATSSNLIVDESGGIITSPAPGPNAVSPGFLAKIQTGLKAGKGLEHLEDNGRSYSVLYSRSDYNRWTYLSIISIADITKESRSIGWLTLWIGLGIIAVAFAVSLIGSRRMYSPIRSLYRAVTGMPAAESAGPKRLSELSVIGERVQSLITEQQQMEQEMQTQLPQLRDLFVIKLLQGEFKAKDIPERMAALRMEELPMPYCVLVLQIDTLEGTHYEEKDFELLMFGVNNIAAEIVPAEKRLNPVLFGSSQVSLIGTDSDDPEQLKREVYEYCIKLQEAIDRFLKLKVSIGISSPYTHLRDANKAYREGFEALQYRVQLGGKAVLFYEEVQPDRSSFEYPKATEAELVDAIKRMDDEQAKVLLRQFLRIVINEKVMLDAYRLALLRLLIELMGIVQENGLGGQMDLPDEQTLVSQLFALKSAADIERWLYEKLVAKTIEALRCKLEHQYSTISGKIVTMVQQELESDLSLELCAERLHLNPDYVGRVFRREMGVTFTDYLLGYRLQVAKKWLLETDMKVADIAERLRYNSSASFIRYFRKMEGMTPGQFRQQAGKEP
jgi:two-component system response regulator YesN